MEKIWNLGARFINSKLSTKQLTIFFFILISIAIAIVIIFKPKDRSPALMAKPTTGIQPKKVYLCPIELTKDTIDIESFNISLEELSYFTDKNRLAISLNNARIELAKRNNCDPTNVAQLAAMLSAQDRLEQGLGESGIKKKGGCVGNIKCACNYNHALEEKHAKLRENGKAVCTVSHYDPYDEESKGTTCHYLLTKGEFLDAKTKMALLNRAKAYRKFRKVLKKSKVTAKAVANKLQGVYATDSKYTSKILSIIDRTKLVEIYSAMLCGKIIVHSWKEGSSIKARALNPQN